MPKNELFDYMASATKRMAERYESIYTRTREDPGTAGDRGEENWANLLEGAVYAKGHSVLGDYLVRYGDVEVRVADPREEIDDLLPCQPSGWEHVGARYADNLSIGHRLRRMTPSVADPCARRLP